MRGKGLLQGMSITLKHFFGKKITEYYPEQKPKLSSRFRGGRLKLNVEKCIGCGVCSVSCPNKVIEIETVKDENNKRQLVAYRYNAGLCLFCNLCVEACPVAALGWTQDVELADYFRERLIFELVALDRKEENSPAAASQGA